MRTLLTLGLVLVIGCSGEATDSGEAPAVDCSEARCFFSLAHPKHCYVALEGSDEEPACMHLRDSLCPTPDPPRNPCLP